MKPSDIRWPRLRPGVFSPYRDWLAHEGSLTRRIRSRCRAFRVRPVIQRLARPCRDECAIAGLRCRELALVREVYLCCGPTPVVFAHTVLDPRGLAGAWRSLESLGDRPLGEALFADPRVTRTPLRFRKLNRHHELYRRACRGSEPAPAFLWARRSLFTLAGASMLVTEVFLPAILRLGR